MASPDTFVPVASRPPPRSELGAWAWVRRGFFDGPWNTALTILTVVMLALVVPPLLNWSVIYAVPGADNQACRDVYGIGACWGVVAEKGRLILFGRYPFDEQWRPLLASALVVLLLIVSCLRTFWRPALALAWVAVFGAFYVLMRGGFLGLTPVETARWGGNRTYPPSARCACCSSRWCAACR